MIVDGCLIRICIIFFIFFKLPRLYTNEDLSWVSWYKKNKSNCGTEMEYMVFTVSLNIIINPHNRKKMYVCMYVCTYVR